MADITAAFPGGFNAAHYPPEQAFDRYSAIAEFTEEFRASGALIHGYAVADGEVHRVKHKDDKSGTKNAWYVLYEHPDFISGCFGHWKNPDARTTWTSFNHSEMSEQQRHDYKMAMEAARVRQEEERKRVHDEVAAQCAAEYNGYPDVTEAHPYLQKKQVASVPGLKWDGLIDLIVPMINENGEIRNLQRINFDGNKLFTPGGEIKGCFFVIPGSDSLILECEGLATGISLFVASGATVYVAFNAGNLPAVSAIARRRHQNAKLIVCGDNDRFTTNTKGEPMNTGRIAAEKAARAAGPGTLWTMPGFPPEDAESTDFNDTQVRYGLKYVQSALGLDVPPAPTYAQPQTAFAAGAMPPHLLTPPGVLGEIARYYNMTARMPQPAFAVQTALAICSTILGRKYRTNKENYTALYFLNIARSTTGKEHIKTVVDRVLDAAGLGALAVGGGYTSAGAVFSTLISKPVHIAVIDEMGKYLESSKAVANVNAREANKIIMEAAGRLHGTLRPNNYSTMNVSAAAKAAMEDRKIVKPSLTIVGMTTPSTFYDNITKEQIKDGFLGRFIVHSSDAERRVSSDPDFMPVPESIINWVKRVVERYEKHGGNLMPFLGVDSQSDPDAISINFSYAAIDLLRQFEHRQIKVMDDLESEGIESLCGRAKEFAMRISLIVALAINPEAEWITYDHVCWACAYIDYHMLVQVVENVRRHMTHSEYDREKKEILTALRKCGARGATMREMKRKSPFSKHTGRSLGAILADLQEAGLVDVREVSKGRVAHVALDPNFNSEEQ
jgi:phage/plasmid primase-like uncharacterized protein